MTAMKEVTEKQLFEKLGQLDVHPSIVSRFPYTQMWKLRNGMLVGKTEDYFTSGGNSGLTATRYYLPS